jgi:hypothetical protein
MFRKTKVAWNVVPAVVLCAAVLFSQQTPVAPSSLGAIEFPVIMRQNIAAGKTPVGTKIQAKLIIATLVSGKVIPRDAILSGEVTESVAKSATDPSRLAIRMDTAQWKTGSAPIKVYLTAWYYPSSMMPPLDLNYGPGGTRKRDDDRGPYYDDPDSPPLQASPSRDPSKDHSVLLPDPPSSNVSKHRVLMKDVGSARNSDGTVTLTSKHSNLKIDKLTTYVLAASDLLPTS